jgi:Fic family protein
MDAEAAKSHLKKYNPVAPYNDLPPLPPPVDLNDPGLLKAAIRANRYLAELKGYCQTLPNPVLLMHSLALQESQASSEIENIVTTQDELFQGIIASYETLPANVKEVIAYQQAMYWGWEALKADEPFGTKLAFRIMQRIKHTQATVRTMPGTRLHNPATGITTYTPPEPQYLEGMLSAWERFITYQTDEVDPLIVMALMHYQFEAIHPFADGNGRTGRILNVLYLVHTGLLTMPVLYHSRYIIQHKSGYYRGLRKVTEAGAWQDWILFMLKAVEETAARSLALIKDIMALKETVTEEIRKTFSRMPAMELSELLFTFPYLKIRVLEERLGLHRETAAKYLKQLAGAGILHAQKVGREVYYINRQLIEVLKS